MVFLLLWVGWMGDYIIFLGGGASFFLVFFLRAGGAGFWGFEGDLAGVDRSGRGCNPRPAQKQSRDDPRDDEVTPCGSLLGLGGVFLGL